MQVEQVDFVSVPTRDFAKAVAWYSDVLGLSASEFSEAEIETPNLTLCFWEPEDQGIPFAPNTNGIALRVPDVDAARAELEAKGVEFDGETIHTSVCRMAFFHDPDGNALILHRRFDV